MSRNKPLQELEGIVVKYKGNGRRLGYPTANIDTDTKLKDGVYFGYADLGIHKKSPSLIFIGTPTTVGDVGRRIEAHLLDIPDVDYYGAHLTLHIGMFYRPNHTFESVEKLKEVMKKDESTARIWFDETEQPL